VQQLRQPSGLFPAKPARPSFREPHRVRVGPLTAGAAIAAVWLLLTGLFAGSAQAYFWLTTLATLAAWAVAVVLVRVGDRGAATGVALVGAFGGTVAFLVFVVHWGITGSPSW
jgi:hypothetical protein